MFDHAACVPVPPVAPPMEITRGAAVLAKGLVRTSDQTKFETAV